jgi:hypothetical protein
MVCIQIRQCNHRTHDHGALLVAHHTLQAGAILREGTGTTGRCTDQD